MEHKFYLFQAELQTLEEQNEILFKEKEELEDKLKASHMMTLEKARLVKDKQDVILSLSSKVRQCLYSEHVVSTSLLLILIMCSWMEKPES